MLLLAAVVCKEPTGPPVINSTSGDTVVSANDSATYACNAWDWGLGPIRFHWSCSHGKLAWDSVPSVKWYAPESSGPAVIRVVVTDEDQLAVSDSVDVLVTKVTTTLINFGGAIKAGHFREWQDSLRLGYALEGNFLVDTNLVSFLVLDDSNYWRWVNSQTYECLVARLFTRADTFDTVVPGTDVYHMVLDNSFGKLEKDFWLFVKTTTP